MYAWGTRGWWQGQAVSSFKDCKWECTRTMGTSIVNRHPLRSLQADHFWGGGCVGGGVVGRFGGWGQGPGGPPPTLSFVFFFMGLSSFKTSMLFENLLLQLLMTSFLDCEI